MAGDTEVPIRRCYVSPGRSALLWWRLVATSTAVCLALGLASAYVRSETFTANSYLYVGKTLSLTQTSAIPGLATAASTIAEDYSRLITTSSVVKATAAALGNHGTDIGGSLGASVIAETPEIEVTATAPSGAAAIRLANEGSIALIGAVDKLNTTASSQLESLKDTYTELEQQINQDTLQQQALQSQLDRETADGSPESVLGPLRDKLATIETTISTDTLNAQTAESQYSTSYSPLVADEQVLQKTAPAVSATGDRKKALEVGGIVGLFAGLLIGVALAAFVDIRYDAKQYGWRTATQRGDHAAG